MIHIGFTGTRQGMTDDQKRELENILKFYLLVELRQPHFHHGDCIGADKEAAYIAREMGYHIVGHLPESKNKRAFFPSDEERQPKSYLERNHDIVDECAVLIVCPKESIEQLRSGTWATYRYAQKRNKDLGDKKTLFLVSPDAY